MKIKEKRHLSNFEKYRLFRKQQQNTGINLFDMSQKYKQINNEDLGIPNHQIKSNKIVSPYQQKIYKQRGHEVQYEQEKNDYKVYSPLKESKFVYESPKKDLSKYLQQFQDEESMNQFECVVTKEDHQLTTKHNQFTDVRNDHSYSKQKKQLPWTPINQFNQKFFENKYQFNDDEQLFQKNQFDNVIYKDENKPPNHIQKNQQVVINQDIKKIKRNLSWTSPIKEKNIQYDYLQDELILKHQEIIFKNQNKPPNYFKQEFDLVNQKVISPRKKNLVYENFEIKQDYSKYKDLSDDPQFVLDNTNCKKQQNVNDNAIRNQQTFQNNQQLNRIKQKSPLKDDFIDINLERKIQQDVKNRISKLQQKYQQNF